MQTVDSAPCFTEAEFETEHARLLLALDLVSDHDSPAFDEGAILEGLDRLNALEQNMPLELRRRFVSPLDPSEDIPF